MNCKNKKVMIELMVSLSVLLIFFIVYQLRKAESQKDKNDYFIISTSANLNGFDPTDPTHSGHVILNNIHDPFDKMIENEQISIPEGTNKDQNKELIFTLKKGLSFHNGDKVTIDDIKFSIEKGQSKENEKYKKLAIDKIDELNKDKKQYKITFKNDVVADDLKNIRILNQRAIEKEKNELAGLKIGTGPYILEPKGYKTKEYVKLKQFKNYYKKDDLTNSYENIMFKNFS